MLLLGGVFCVMRLDDRRSWLIALLSQGCANGRTVFFLRRGLLCSYLTGVTSPTTEKILFPADPPPLQGQRRPDHYTVWMPSAHAAEHLRAQEEPAHHADHT